MAESAIISALLPLLFEKLASGVQQQLGKMLGVRRELEKLQSTLTTIQSVLQDAEEKEVKDVALRNWLEKLKNAAYDADDVLDEAHYELLRRSADIHHGFMNKVNDFFSASHNPLFFRAKMARKVKDVVERLDAIAKERSNFHLRIDGAVAGERQQFEWRQTHSYVIESDVIERGDDKKRIIEMLLSHESSSSSGSLGSHPRVLPIVGMGGLGKTTLAQMVYNDEKMSAHFELRMWVCVSDDFRIARLAKEIIESGQSGSVTGDPNLDQLQHKLRETIGSKRYLLVLDDIWNEDPQKWEGLRDLLAFGGQGSTIIVTTRSDIVATIVGTIGPYRLAHLSEDGCWELFENKAFPGGVGKRPELVQIGKKISERCKGLPLAAKVIGSMMHLKTEEREWMNVLNSEVWEMQDRKDGIIPVLKLSYHQLHPHLKQCFAFCAIFPKDYKIDKEYLIQLWMANGLIPTEGRLELEEKGDYIFKELASRSFFQDIKEEFNVDNTTSTACKIHDLIHDLAQSIMGKDCVILNDEMLKITSNDTAIRHLVIVNGTTLSTLNDGIDNSCKTLRTLVVPVNPFPMEVLYSIWSNLRSLRVLDLRQTNISDVPISINNLKHLRYLDLSDTEIKTLPKAISQLFYLQTLKIKRCHKLRELPKGMRNMCNLRHVYNSGCIVLDGIPRGLGKLSQLQTLSMFVASERAGSSSIAELEDLNLGGMLHLRRLENVMSRTDAAKAGLCSKKKIKSLVLEWRPYTKDDSKDNPEEILEALRPHEEIRNLRINRYPGQQCPSWLVSSGLVSFRDNLLPALHSLRKLDIWNCERLTGGEGGGLKLQHLASLEVLNIYECRALHSVNLEGLHRLRDLYISHCSKLYGLQGLTALRLLSLSNLATETTLPDWLPTLTGLNALDIWDCPALTALPDGMEGLTLLESVSIGHCPLLAGLPVGLQQRLPHLQTLWITRCPLLKGRCKKGGDYWHLVSSIPSMSVL